MLLACNYSEELVEFLIGGPGEVFEWRSDKDALRRQLIRLMDICKYSELP